MRRLGGGNGASGFSLLELVLVLALVAVVAAWAIPAFYARPSVTLDNAALLLARDLRSAQNRAAARRAPVEVRFFEDGDGYEAVDAYGRHLPDPGGGGAFVRRYSRDAVFEGVRLANLDGTLAHPVRYDARGFAEEDARLVVTYGGASRQVSLEGGTGLVEIDGLDEPWTDDGL